MTDHKKKRGLRPPFLITRPWQRLAIFLGLLWLFALVIRSFTFKQQQSQSWKASVSPVNMDVSSEQYFQNVLKIYLKERDRGLSQKEITEKVFGVSVDLNQKIFQFKAFVRSGFPIRTQLDPTLTHSSVGTPSGPLLMWFWNLLGQNP